MFQVSEKTLSVQKTRRLNNKQLAMLNRMSKNEKTKYLATLLGISPCRMWLPRMRKHGADPLAEKGTYEVLRRLSRLIDTENIHRPTNQYLGAWIGVEIEFFLPAQTDDGLALSGSTQRLFLIENLRNDRVKRCNVKYDRSLSCENGGHPVEVTLLINSQYGFSDLEKLCGVLKRMGAYVNRSCGLHVHFDARDKGSRGVAKFGRSIGRCLPFLSQMVPPSRRSNTYCALGVSKMRGDRYFAVNLTAYSKYQTCEVRLHSGTTDFNKIKNWIQIVALCGQASILRAPKTLEAMFRKTNMPEHLQTYVKNRIAMFSTSNADQVDAA